MADKLSFANCRGLLVQMANKLATFNQYSWSADFCLSETKDLFKRQSEKYEINPHDFTREELEILGCAKWEDESDLFLLPIWMVPFLPQGFKLESFGGDFAIVGTDDFDKDIRFGCVAWGINKAA